MAKKLFVGNLPFSMTEDQLHAMFTAEGPVVSARLITDKFSGQSRGFGFVEIADDAQAAACIEKLNGTSMEGRKLVVNEARPMEQRSGGGGRRDGGGGRDGGGRKQNFNRW